MFHSALLQCYIMTILASALRMTMNPVFHARSKHVELDYYFVRERVALGLLTTQDISITDQVADLFSKPMSKAALKYFQTKLCLQPQHNSRGSINRPHKLSNPQDNMICEDKWSDKSTSTY